MELFVNSIFKELASDVTVFMSRALQTRDYLLVHVSVEMA
jgi:hypothetical protein